MGRIVEGDVSYRRPISLLCMVCVMYNLCVLSIWIQGLPQCTGITFEYYC
jgi:hypothetical protein